MECVHNHLLSVGVECPSEPPAILHGKGAGLCAHNRFRSWSRGDYHGLLLFLLFDHGLVVAWRCSNRARVHVGGLNARPSLGVLHADGRM